MYTEPFDITAGERAHAIAEHPSLSQPIFDPTDPRCETPASASEAVAAPGARTLDSARSAARLRSHERSRHAG